MPRTKVYPIDLHTHSTASDGRLSPEELVAYGAAQGIEVLSLTDHDSVGGIDAAWSEAKQVGIEFIPGIELSTALSEGECHILGYFLDHSSPTLLRTLVRVQASRRERGRRMVEQLRALGVPVSWELVQEVAGEGTITRTHIAEALLNVGAVGTRQQAFERYIGRGGPAYVPRYKLSPEEAIALIRETHGVPVLAHPTFVDPHRDWGTDQPRFPAWPFLERLREAGLLGLEAYYGEYSADLAARLADLAKRYGLIRTGGSDFHGDAETPALGSVAVPPEVVGALRRLARHCSSPWLKRTFVSGAS